MPLTCREQIASQRRHISYFEEQISAEKRPEGLAFSKDRALSHTEVVLLLFVVIICFGSHRLISSISFF